MNLVRYISVILWAAVIWCAGPIVAVSAENNCAAIQTDCKSPESGAPLSDECIALRQRCDPYFSLSPNLAIPGQNSAAYIVPEVPKLISPDPYSNAEQGYYPKYRYYGFYGDSYRQPRLYYPPIANGGYAGVHGDGGWAYQTAPWQDHRRDIRTPYHLLMEPGRSGFSEQPVEEDFLFFWRSGMYYPYGGGGAMRGFGDVPPYYENSR